MPLVLPYPTAPIGGFSPSLTSHPDHFALSSYERALRLPTFFAISCLARFGVKPRNQFPSRNLPSLTVEFTLSSLCSCSDPPLSSGCGSSSPWLSSTLQSGTLDKRLCSIPIWQRRLFQLLSLWH